MIMHVYLSRRILSDKMGLDRRVFRFGLQRSVDQPPARVVSSSSSQEQRGWGRKAFQMNGEQNCQIDQRLVSVALFVLGLGEVVSVRSEGTVIVSVSLHVLSVSLVGAAVDLHKDAETSLKKKKETCDRVRVKQQLRNGCFHPPS